MMGRWPITLEMEAVLPRSANTNYPALVDGAGACDRTIQELAPSEFKKFLAKYRRSAKSHEFREDESPRAVCAFDPGKIVFDDPDDMWIYLCCEEPLMTETLELSIEQSPSALLSDGHYAIKIPARLRNLLLELQIAEPQFFMPLVDKTALPEFVTMVVDRDQLLHVVGELLVTIYSSTDVHLIRRLRRIDWYLKLIRNTVEAKER